MRHHKSSSPTGIQSVLKGGALDLCAPKFQIASFANFFSSTSLQAWNCKSPAGRLLGTQTERSS